MGTVPAHAFSHLGCLLSPSQSCCSASSAPGTGPSMSLISRSDIIYPQRDTGEDLLGTMGVTQGICTPCAPCLWLHHQHSQRCSHFHPAMPSSSVQRMLQAVPALQAAQPLTDVLARVRKHPSKAGEQPEGWQHSKREREG